MNIMNIRTIMCRLRLFYKHDFYTDHMYDLRNGNRTKGRRARLGETRLVPIRLRARESGAMLSRRVRNAGKLDYDQAERR